MNSGLLRASFSLSKGYSPPSFTPQTERTYPPTCTPSAARYCFAMLPAATRTAVSLALARSSMLRASVCANFFIPVRSACPGRTRVSVRALTSHPSAAMYFSQLG